MTVAERRSSDSPSGKITQINVASDPNIMKPID